MTNRLSQLMPRDHVSIALIGLGLVGSVLVGLLVGRASVAGAVLVVAALMLPWMVVVEGAPLWTYFGLFPLLWQWEIGSVSALNALAVVCLAGWAVGILARRQPNPLPLSIVDVCVGAFFGVSLLSILTRTGERADWYLQIYLLSAGLYILARSLTMTTTNLSRALWALVLGTSAAAVVAIWNYLNGSAVRSQGLDRLAQEGIGVNNFAAILLAGTAAAFGLALAEHQKPRRLLLWIAIVLLTLAIVLSKSRGAFVGQAVLIVGAFLLVRHASQRVVVTAVAGALLVLLLPGPASSLGIGDYANRMREMIIGDDVETPRTYLWQMGIEAFRDQPLTGIGIGNFTSPNIWFALANRIGAPPWVTGPSDVHSFFIGTLADVGLIGSIPLVISIVVVAFSVRRVLAAAEHTSMAGPAYAVAFVLASYFAAIALLPAQTLALPYMAVGIAEGLRRAAIAEHVRGELRLPEAGDISWGAVRGRFGGPARLPPAALDHGLGEGK